MTRLSLAAAAVLAAVRDGNVVPQAVGFEYRAACAEAEAQEPATRSVDPAPTKYVPSRWERVEDEPAHPVGPERPGWDASASVAAALDTDNDDERRPTPREEIT